MTTITEKRIKKEPKEIKEHTHNHKKLMYILDELVVLVVIVITILFSEIIKKILHRDEIGIQDFNFNVWTVISSMVIATVIYMKFSSDFKYEENKKKPHLSKRIYSAFSQAIMWKTLADATGI